jgi:DNA-binding transcriptional LysR family regulator
MKAPPRSAATARHVEVFRAVLQAGSFTRAAQRLHTSQPSVSRLIKELQAAVGFTLFTRSGVNAAPTAEALELYREVERSFLGFERVMLRARDIRENRIGVLRIISMPALAWSFMPGTLAEFLKERPGVQASLQVQRSEAVPAWIGSQQYDLGFAMFPTEVAGVETSLFDPAEGMCVLPPAHRLVAQEVVDIADLAGEVLVSLGPDGLVQRTLDRAFAAAGVAVRSRIETPLTSIACQFVREGLGLTIADPFTALAFADQGLAARPFRPRIAFNFGILLPSYAARSALVEDFIATARARRDSFLRGRL